MIQSILLQADGGGSPIGGLLPLLLIIVVMYLFFFRPQMKKQKEEKRFRSEVTKGMRIVTSSGVHGKVLDVDDNTFLIESENSRLRIEKSAVSREMSAQYLPKKDDKKK